MRYWSLITALALIFAGLGKSQSLFDLLPTIRPELQDQVVPLGESANFSVSTEIEGPFTYEWFLNNERLEGEIGRELSILDMTWEKVGEVFVRVSNGSYAQTAIAQLDVESAPEILYQPSNQLVVSGAAVDFFFRFRGARPLTYELIEKPEGSDFALSEFRASFGSPATFHFWRAGSSQFTPSEIGSYTLRVSNAFGSQDLSFELEMANPDLEPRFGGQRFVSLLNLAVPLSLEVSNSDFNDLDWIWDEHHQRFLNPNVLTGDTNERFVAIERNGEVAVILDQEVDVPDYSRIKLVGFDPVFGLVFVARVSNISGNDLLAKKDGLVSLLVSAGEIEETLGVSKPVDFDLQTFDGSVVGYVEAESYDSENEWAIFKFDQGGLDTLATEEAFPRLDDVDECYLGCDRQFRPLIGMEPETAETEIDGVLEVSPRIDRIEPDGSLVTLLGPPQLSNTFFRESSGFQSSFDREDSKVQGMSGNGPALYGYWEQMIVEIVGDGLLVHPVDTDENGNSLFNGDYNERHFFATEHQVYFQTRVFPGVLNFEERQLIAGDSSGDTFNTPFSFQERVYSWSVEGIQEVFSGSSFDGFTEGQGLYEGVIGATGDQVLINHRDPLSEDFDPALILGNFGGETVRAPNFAMGREGPYLRLPLGTQLETSTTLLGPWTSTETPSRSFPLSRVEEKQFFRTRLSE